MNMDRQLVIFHVESVIAFLEKQNNNKENSNIPTTKNITNMDDAIQSLKTAYALLMKG
jgi:hypothetical protein